MFGDVIHGIWEDSKLVKVLDMWYEYNNYTLNL